ncbi:2-dehydro-3-deoxyphosphogluconate aldolase/(4S)-4-hydroxy-2-oxoglutarate aldolase [Paenibacillus cellulosilyticus]|uniref:2-dehydro-3-deoxyphosphogluconate aldolase/(4S)-4-hydroxy-2-oxoglutarate aldolase n=1 Tax=Paenibacillus cellulosilyticus TaxID=375489 RepID=A0A2V2YXG5_9BACL|nr:bifunctional 4-hydroxy-2-oxoglutarate aldolase/2-dehydro-3-deoxy-phosphogluconate aldolase [Paenibacillus cellulosilyticus]PWV97303.1 2-dehydro-3-deoxyphosphogluconate aldolase/(4S)-4-hydroxy-2-oxoglutarate aldolase [Paenibacillus cellulosilyticus]QKS47495.1 bifunctional 4-hydroxy-2-oxoglutarate aldolase/2-dehydro-3-deoxy-phosphogluconate aldolase [Paenibacillus cellulosilyticus]
MSELLDMLHQHKIVAILRGIEAQHADQTAQAIIDGGVRLLEVTMNTEGATAIINQWRTKFGDGKARIGAGTVLDVEMAREAVAAGAQFIISPNLDEEVIAYGVERGISVWPGCMTPTEIVRAWKAGAEAVKVFPMASLGVKYLAEIRAPLNNIPMLATGGVDIDNIGDYFRAGACAVGMGSKLVNLDWIRAGEYERVTERVRQFVQVAASL